MAGQNLLADYVQSSDKLVGRGHPTKSDTLNRAIRKILLLCGINPDGIFSGFFPVYNVKAFGAVGDGGSHPLSAYYSTLAAAQVDYSFADSLTNEIDWAATQAAVNAAGIGGRLAFPPGKYNMGGKTITGTTHQSWEGSYQLGTGGVPGTDGRTCLSWTSALGANNGVTGGVNQVFRRIMFSGAGKNTTTGTAVKIGDAINSNHSRFEWCQFYDFGQCVNTTNGFYVSFDTCEFVRPAIAIMATSAYNMHLINCTARLWDNVYTNTGGVLFDTTTSVRHLSVEGGSIEGFSSSGAIILAGGFSLVDLFGVYFESSVVGANAFGVDVRADGVTVNAVGCLVYLTELNRWINMSGRDKCVLVSRGNHFVCANTSTSNPAAYVLPNNTTSGSIDIGPDNWIDVALAGANYVSSINSPIANCARVIAPKSWASSTLRDVEVKGRPMWLVAQSASPSGPITGTLAHADKTNWNPCGFSSGDPYLAWWDNTRWQPVSRPTFVGSKAFDPLSIAANTFATAVTTISVTGARAGDEVKILFTNDTQGTYFRGRVTANDVVTVDHDNRTGGPIDLASGTLTAVCVRY